MQRHRIALFVLCLAAAGQPVLGTETARAFELFSRVPTVHVTVAGLKSQAQLADQLRALGATATSS